MCTSTQYENTRAETLCCGSVFNTQAIFYVF